MDAFGSPRLGLDVALALCLGGEEQLVSRGAELSSGPVGSQAEVPRGCQDAQWVLLSCSSKQVTRSLWCIPSWASHQGIVTSAGLSCLPSTRTASHVHF